MPYSHEIQPLIEPEYYNKLTKPEAVRLGSKTFQPQNHSALPAELYTNHLFSPSIKQMHFRMGSYKNTVPSSS